MDKSILGTETHKGQEEKEVEALAALSNMFNFGSSMKTLSLGNLFIIFLIKILFPTICTYSLTFSISLGEVPNHQRVFRVSRFQKMNRNLLMEGRNTRTFSASREIDNEMRGMIVEIFDMIPDCEIMTQAKRMKCPFTTSK